MEKARPNQPSRRFPREGGDTYLSVAQARIDRQLDDIDALDAKGGVIIGTALAEAAVVLSLWALRPEGSSLRWCHWILLALVAMALAATVVLGGLGLRMREWRRYPDPDEAWALREEQHLAWELAMVVDKAFEVNAEPERIKQVHVRRSAVSLAALTGAALVAAILLVSV